MPGNRLSLPHTLHRLRTAESLAEATVISHTGIAARSAASLAAGTGSVTNFGQHAAAHSPQSTQDPTPRLLAAQQHRPLVAAAAAPSAVQPGAQAASQTHHRLRHLRLSCGCRADLQPLLQLCCPEQLTIATLPAITDALWAAHTWHQHPSVGQYLLQTGNAFLTGAIPVPLRVKLPVGASLRVLHIDTTRTCAGMEFDDRALLDLTSSCQQLQVLRVRALLCFGQDAGPALRRLQGLQELQLSDVRWQSVQSLLLLAAEASQITDSDEMREVALQLLRWLSFCITSGGFAVEATLRGHRVWRGLAWVAMTALALPVSTAATAAAVPVHKVLAARLSAAALRAARRETFVVRPCWLPHSLRLLQLQDATLRCHRHCMGCACSVAQGSHPPRLHVVQLQVQHDFAGTHRLQHSSGASWGSSTGGSSSGAAALLAAVKRELKAGRRQGLYPRLWGVVSRVMLVPLVPFAVAVTARAGVRKLLTPSGRHSLVVLLRLCMLLDEAHG